MKFDNLIVNEVHDVPNPETVCLKSMSGIANIVDACNQALKSRHLLKKSLLMLKVTISLRLSFIFLIKIISLQHNAFFK